MIRDSTQVAQPIAASSRLPSQFPKAPEALLKAFPEFAAYHAHMERLYKAIRESTQSTSDSVTTATTQQQTNLSNWHRDSAGRMATDLDVVGKTITAVAFQGGTLSGSNAQLSGTMEVTGESTLNGDTWITTKLRRPAPDGWSVVLDAGGTEIAIRHDTGTGKIHFRVNGTDVGGVLPA